MTSPVYTVFAQQFLPAELWVPFFNFMQFLTGVRPSLSFVNGFPCLACQRYHVQTYFNIKIKKMRLEAEEKAKKEREGKKD